MHCAHDHRLLLDLHLHLELLSLILMLLLLLSQLCPYLLYLFLLVSPALLSGCLVLLELFFHFLFRSE